MLVVTRRKGEGLRIGEDVVVHVGKLKAGSVRLAIEAPPHVRVVRSELPLFTSDPKESSKTEDPCG